jgi:hypothetical protein
VQLAPRVRLVRTELMVQSDRRAQRDPQVQPARPDRKALRDPRVRTELMAQPVPLVLPDRTT